MTSNHPMQPADVSAGWLTSVLGESGGLTSGSVVGVEREPVGEGVGMMSEIEILHLTYDSAEGDMPATLVAKFGTLNETNRAVAMQFDVYRREVRYYAELDSQTSATGPKIHVAHIDEDQNFVILMEDLSGYRLGDQVIGATLEDSEAGVDEMAKLHASFWNQVDKPELEWLPWHANSNHATSMLEGCRAGWDTSMEVFGNHIPEAIANMREQFLAAVPAMQDWLVTAPVTVVHGDFRMDNLFFGTQPGQSRLALIDWQGPLRSSGVQDLAYLLTHNTQLDVRREHERALVDRYVDQLEANGVSGYSKEEAWEDYRRATLYLWIYVVVISGTLDPSNERGMAWMTKMVQRSVAAIEDLNCRELLKEFQP